MSSPIESVLKEKRKFPPPAGFAADAHIKSAAEYERLWQRGRDDPEGFWAEQAARKLHWFRTWDRVLDWKPPHARWFVGGTTNASYNCLDRHLAGPRKNKAAIVWEGEPGDSRVLTFHQLHRETCKFANCLKKLGVKKGDRVTIYMPMVPEAAVAMLACARIGATHSVVFGGFSAEAVADRNNDARSKLVITADGGWRRGKVIPLKANVDAALAKSPTVEKCVVLNWYVSTHPGSHFVSNLLAARPVPAGRYGLRNNELSVHLPDGTTKKRTLADGAELRAALTDVFRIALPEWSELDAVLAQVAAKPVAGP